MQNAGKRRAARALQSSERCSTVAPCCEIACCQAHNGLRMQTFLRSGCGRNFMLCRKPVFCLM